MPDSPYYAGSFAFFPNTGENFGFHVARAGSVLRKLAERGEFDDSKPLRVTIVGTPREKRGKRPLIESAPPVPFREVSLRITHGKSQ